MSEEKPIYNVEISGFEKVETIDTSEVIRRAQDMALLRERQRCMDLIDAERRAHAKNSAQYSVLTTVYRMIEAGATPRQPSMFQGG
jgi:hypothetical protein